MSDKMIVVASDYYPRPVGRHYADGEYSGERFRKENLIPKLDALAQGETLIVDFNGVTMAGSSFLEEAFGGLVRKEGYDKDMLLKILKIVTKRAVIKQRIEEYISVAKKQ